MSSPSLHSTHTTPQRTSVFESSRPRPQSCATCACVRCMSRGIVFNAGCVNVCVFMLRECCRLRSTTATSSRPRNIYNTHRVLSLSLSLQAAWRCMLYCRQQSGSLFAPDARHITARARSWTTPPSTDEHETTWRRKQPTHTNSRLKTMYAMSIDYVHHQVCGGVIC